MLPGLVVLHDSPRAERLEVDAVDLSREREPVAELEPAELASARAPNDTSKRRGTSVSFDAASARTNASRSRQSVWSSSCRWSSVSSMRTPFTAWSRQLRRNGSARSSSVSSRRSTPSSLGIPLKNLFSALCATEPRSFGSTSASIVLGSRSRSTNHADEQSEKRSSSVTLKLVRSPRYSRTSGWCSRVGRRNARSARSSRRSHPFASASASASDSSAEASAATARSRSRSVGAASSGHVSADSGRRVVARRTSSGGKSRGGLVPERAALPRRAVVARRLAHEVEPPRRARARRVEEVAVARDLVRLDEPRLAERPARVVVEERGSLRPPWERSLLEPEQEDDFEAARARAEEVEHRDAARLSSVRPADGRALERADDLLGGERAADREPAFELVDEPRRRLRTRAGRGARRRSPEGVACRRRGGASARPSRAAPSSGVDASRSSLTIGNGLPCKASVSASTRSCALIARPRRRPSRKSAFARGTPEYGARRKP